MNFFDTKYYDDNTSQTGFSQGNTLFINKVQPKTHTVNEAKEKKDEHDIGAYLANGVTSIEEVSSESGNNFFTQGNGISDSETSAVNVQEQTKLLAGFKIAYSNFTSFPNKQTAIKLKASYKKMEVLL